MQFHKFIVGVILAALIAQFPVALIAQQASAPPQAPAIRATTELVLVNVVARWTHSVALSLRGAQTGRLRQYVMFIVVGTVGLFVLISFFLKSTLAGQ